MQRGAAFTRSGRCIFAGARSARSATKRVIINNPCENHRSSAHRATLIIVGFICALRARAVCNYADWMISERAHGISPRRDREDRTKGSRSLPVDPVFPPLSLYPAFSPSFSRRELQRSDGTLGGH